MYFIRVSAFDLRLPSPQNKLQGVTSDRKRASEFSCAPSNKRRTGESNKQGLNRSNILYVADILVLTQLRLGGLSMLNLSTRPLDSIDSQNELD